jgi:ubiquinone/menaquinone biosynthesis C-methylase UbiE
MQAMSSAKSAVLATYGGIARGKAKGQDLSMPPLSFDQTFLMAMNEYRQSSHVQRRFQQYLELLNPLPGQKILDLGCGTGDFCRALAPHIAPKGQIVGVDYTSDAIAVATRLSANSDVSLLTFEYGDGHHLRYEDSSFDAAACISVLAFCTQPVQVLRELRRILRDQGRLLVVASDEDTRIFNSHDRALGRRVLQVIADRTHEPWSGRRLTYWLHSAGFRVVSEAIHTNVEHKFAPGDSGYTMAHALRPYLLNNGIGAQDYDRWLAELQSCAEEGSYCYCTTSFGYLVEKST